MDISNFNEKFNKIEGNIYVIEEKIEQINGVYEGELAHDNINIKTLNVYTGSKLTGEKIESYSISTPSFTPWKTIIKVFSEVTPLYISYETVGDQVEAEDINKLQDTLVFTQQNLNEEIHRATKSENILIDNLNSEVVRSTQVENNIAMNLNTEVNRSKNVEDAINKELSNEVKRAINAEKVLTDNVNTTNSKLTTERDRAEKAEEILTKSINNEISRAKSIEDDIKSKLNEEFNRSKKEETSIVNNLENEVKRAIDAEKILTDNLNSEIYRSKTKENNIEENINSYKSSNNIEIQKLKEKDIDFQNKKSDLSYVNSELNKRYTKDQTFTREEVLQKIKDIIGTAPEALDTLQEIAKALNNDADFAGTMTKQLTTKVDKTQGKQLTDENYTLEEKNKLSKIEKEANNYVHPANHSADIIVDNPNKRFTNDAEKSKNLESYNKKHEHLNKTTLDRITDNLINKWSDANTHVNDNVRHITDEERKLWNTVSKKSDNGHVHNYNELSNKPLIPTKTSELNNDFGFITQKDIDTSQNHIHSNKSVLDEINKSLIDNWNTVSNKVDKRHKHSISEINNMPSSLPANGGTASRIYGSMASNDFIRIEGQGKDDNGSLEIATADNGNEPIYVRQYTGSFATISRTLTLLDSNGNTICPGTLNANNLQVCGANVYTTNRKPTASEIGAMAKGPIKWNDLKGV
ncbi:hypothetical protein HYH38_02285 [Clostridium botulinum]|uniref:hypothetical protein n=1 Tax=Clostridium botulinum TaxID=1491 RepID=UPI000174E74D|nr:hypothetical protein [Clostridium botulinum]ACD52736.1 conserved hypothetical protein [Clostridium botulinum E3 str. Alaska E43]MBY6789952.1 hypothetical protein [Clostridium botulinum]MBY6818210.1 hypothetical protein [Clostridium botulinum]MBY6826110.1 hypothetical protein [Clostridium botulinum]MBY6858058.1 hypothetical protein [Clostridium botulinum]